jgi:hypothetical protein
MNARFYLILAAAAVVLGAMFTRREHRRHQDADQAFTAARDAQAATTASIATQETVLRVARAKQAELTQALDEARKAAPATKPVTLANAPTPSSPRPTVNLFQIFEAHPEFHALYLKALRANLDARYGPFFATNNISPEKRAAVVAALAQNAEALSDIMTAAQAKKLPPNDPAIQRLRAQAESALTEEITTALGADGFGQYQSFRRSLPSRNAVNDLVVHQFPTDAPLTLRQSNELTELLHQNPLQPVPTRNGITPVAPAKFEAVLSQARPLLSAPQFATFEMMVRSQEATQTMMKLAMDAGRIDRGDPLPAK